MVVFKISQFISTKIFLKLGHQRRFYKNLKFESAPGSQYFFFSKKLRYFFRRIFFLINYRKHSYKNFWPKIFLFLGFLAHNISLQNLCAVNFWPETMFRFFREEFLASGIFFLSFQNFWLIQEILRPNPQLRNFSMSKIWGPRNFRVKNLFFDNFRIKNIARWAVATR